MAQKIKNRCANVWRGLDKATTSTSDQELEPDEFFSGDSVILLSKGRKVLLRRLEKRDSKIKSSFHIHDATRL